MGEERATGEQGPGDGFSSNHGHGGEPGIMSTQGLTIGLVGCGSAARIHAERLAHLEGVELVGFVDPNLDAARGLAEKMARPGQAPAPAFGDHARLLEQARPQAVAIFTPHRAHYQPALDALQAGCHVFVEKPLSTNPQEAMDLVRLARGRNLLVGVGHQYRLRPSLREARRRLLEGELGRVRLATAVMARPWLQGLEGADPSWRSDPRVSGGGMIADAGDHLLDALLWTAGQTVAEVAAFRDRVDPGLDVVDAVTIRLAAGTLATLGLAGTTARSAFELVFYGDRGWIRVTENALEAQGADGDPRVEEHPAPTESIDGNFVGAIQGRTPLCCPAEEALETVKLQDAIARSAATGQVVRLA